MTYDEKLADRIRHALPPTSMIDERKMFGGLAFLLDGKMFVGVTGAELMVRVGPAAYEGALAQPHARPMDFTGRPLTGFIYVGAAGVRTSVAVGTWVRRAMAFVETLPAKARKRRPRARPKRRPKRNRKSPS
jgi:TfoX/Sxy family transcriptional regulator of competence genes